MVGCSEISKANCLYDPSTHKVIECRDVVFDGILTHCLLGYFPLRFTLQMVSMDLSSPHFDDDSSSTSVSSSTLSIVTRQMDIDNENLTSALEVSSFVMIAPSSILVVV